ncbi:MAG: hypothetical protein HUJ13_01570, partial [Hydrogenovibrio crunogenus]|nr:hypothetical protein [Hydrogenovibrio crunogenus]
MKALFAKFFNPYTALIFVCAIAFTYITAKAEGYKNGFNQAQNDALTKEQQAVARAIEQTNAINRQDAEIAQAYWQQQSESQPKIQTVEKKVIQYVKTIEPGHC